MTIGGVEWAAGLFEGEGTACLDKNGYPVLAIHMTDEDVLLHFLEVVGLGRINGPYTYTNPKYKPYWTWHASCDDAKDVALMFVPYLGMRRLEQVSKLFAWTRTQKRVAECGTISGYNRHKHHTEPICETCRLAMNEYNRFSYHARKVKQYG